MGERSSVSVDHFGFVLCEFVDYAGLIRSRLVPREHFGDARERGVNFSKAIMSYNVADAYLPDRMYSPADGDFWAVPDLPTLRPAPFHQGVGMALCDLVDERGQPWPGCPRTALRAALAAIEAELGGRFIAAFEPEITLVHPAWRGPADTCGAFAPRGIERQWPFVERVLHGARAMGLEVVQVSKECAPGQLEFNLAHKPLVEACDDLVAFRQLAKAAADAVGVIATMMPKPFPDRPGNGLHLHISMTYGEAKNLFADPDDETGLSQLAYSFLAGIIAHAPAVLGVAAPSVNSYKRLVPGHWAPTWACYGPGNRSALIRIPEKRRGTRIEYRGGDASANPYLYALGVVVAGAAGVREGLKPGPPVREDVDGLSPTQLAERGTVRLPAHLGEALDALNRDPVLTGALPGPLLVEYTRVRHSEWDAYLRAVTDWDVKTYGEVI